MEYQIIRNPLYETCIEGSKYTFRNWIEIKDKTKGTYN